MAFARFLHIAMSSDNETQYDWLLARNLSYVNALEYQQIEDPVIEVKRMLAALIQKLTSDS